MLKECGNIVNWKRMRNEKDVPMSYGYCEFETIEGVFAIYYLYLVIFIFINVY
jgi:hypothetical protein